MISSSKMHYTIQMLDFSTRFTIRTVNVNCSTLFLGAWLCGWAVGEIYVASALVKGVIQYLTTGESFLGAAWLFMLVWLAVWTVGGGTALVTLLWQVAGSEVVEISHDAFKIGRKVFGIGPSNSYNPTNIDNLRVDESLPAVSQRVVRFSSAGLYSSGRLVFDYGGAQVRFGSGLDSNEAKLLLAEIQRRYPRYSSR